MEISCEQEVKEVWIIYTPAVERDCCSDSMEFHMAFATEKEAEEYKKKDKYLKKYSWIMSCQFGETK